MCVCGCDDTYNTAPHKRMYVYICVCVGVCDAYAYASTTTCAKHMQILFEFSCLFVLWLLLLLLFG